MTQVEMTDAVWNRIKSLRQAGLSYGQIAAETGVPTSTVGNVVRGPTVRPPRKRRKPRDAEDLLPSIDSALGSWKAASGDPTPAEIADACERLRRHRYRDPHYCGTIRCDDELADCAEGGAS